MPKKIFFLLDKTVRVATLAARIGRIGHSPKAEGLLYQGWGMGQMGFISGLRCLQIVVQVEHRCVLMLGGVFLPWQGCGHALGQSSFWAPE